MYIQFLTETHLSSHIQTLHEGIQILNLASRNFLKSFKNFQQFLNWFEVILTLTQHYVNKSYQTKQKKSRETATFIINYRRSYSYKEQDKIQCFSMLTRQIKIEALDLGVSREMNLMQHIYSEQKHITSLKALYFYRNDVILF